MAYENWVSMHIRFNKSPYTCRGARHSEREAINGQLEVVLAGSCVAM